MVLFACRSRATARLPLTRQRDFLTPSLRRCEMSTPTQVVQVKSSVGRKVIRLQAEDMQHINLQ
jgi:hypothetical protein